MYTKTTALLALAALTTAAPTSNPSAPSLPAIKTSKAFRLVVSVTDPTKDLTPSINGWEIFTYPQATGLPRAGLASVTSAGNLFYQYRDPATNVSNGYDAQLLTEGLRGPENVMGLRRGDPPSGTWSQRLVMNLDDQRLGETGLQVSTENGVPQVVGGGVAFTFAMCTSTVPRFGGPGETSFLGLEWLFQFEKVVPEGCVPVKLLPECAVLHDVPEGSKAEVYHKGAVEVECFESVKGIEL